MQCFFSPGYFVPLPEGHPFPIGKYPLSLQWLRDNNSDQKLTFHQVQPVDWEVLSLAHSREYLRRVEQNQLSKYDRNRLGLPHHPRFVERSRLDVAGTLAAAEAALENGIAWNLGGGTHHAMRDRGLGFCVTNDVSVAALHLKARYPDLQILVVDTDAHQGNGNHAILRGTPGVFTYSIHVGANYPAIKEPGDLDVPLPRNVDGRTYLTRLRSSLKTVASRFHPDLVFWISGVDVHVSDRFGQMGLSTDEISTRNHLVLEWASGFEAAVVGTYGGGYHADEKETPALHARTVRDSIAYAVG